MDKPVVSGKAGGGADRKGGLVREANGGTIKEGHSGRADPGGTEGGRFLRVQDCSGRLPHHVRFRIDAVPDSAAAGERRVSSDVSDGVSRQDAQVLWGNAQRTGQAQLLCGGVEGSDEGL